MAIENIVEQLSQDLGLKLEVTVNDNRSRLVAVKQTAPCSARLSLHRIFLKAPDSVVRAIGSYLRQKDRHAYKTIQEYLQTRNEEFDYSNRVSATNLSTKGQIYDLREIFDEINQEYFSQSMHLKVTWFGKADAKVKRHVVFGRYFEHMRLIKINRLLDDPFYPKYFVSFVMYHEMLHHLVPPYLDAKGVWQRHGTEFKAKERQFHHYRAATKWLKMHKGEIFSS